MCVIIQIELKDFQSLTRDPATIIIFIEPIWVPNEAKKIYNHKMEDNQKLEHMYTK